MSNHESNINHHELEHNHGSYKSYINGFIFSIIFTLIPYFTITSHIYNTATTYIIITVAALLQLFIQLLCFLHMGQDKKPYWNILAFAFTVIIVGILVIGSLWIMYNLNYNMMENI